MKNILTTCICIFFLYGCGEDLPIDLGQSNEITSSNIEISLGNDKLVMSLPSTWEKLKAFPEKGIIFLARKNTQNIVITNEKGFTENITDRLLKTLKESLSIVEEVSKDENTLVFRGKLSSTNPMREFHQKVVPLPDANSFLLVSCSQEVVNLGNLECPDILESFVLVGE